VIEAESQVVLNTLTEYDFQDAFKKWQKSRERCICMEGNCFEVFDQMAAPVPEIMDDSLYFMNQRNVCEWMQLLIKTEVRCWMYNSWASA
jgi:hypothetical protein